MSFLEQIVKNIHRLDGEELLKARKAVETQLARSIRVEGLPEEFNSDHLADLFSELGPLGGYSIKRSPTGSKYGVITLQNDQATARALQRDGMVYLGEHKLAISRFLNVTDAAKKAVPNAVQ
uniref:RRM domain-containing protein n=1 Tax=Eutreptiella gymnastica TaxID=73025 RepID=A0A7S1IXZ3_9EUGL|mmetsp:Transcript_51286/g.91670  ORF Transcript_51286/g.91670 Transcript_51286/m.91670 type:complete len:122 (+) Transcript_51286:228-593(+)